MSVGSITYTVSDLIQSPPYTQASILSDEVHTERDLLIDVVSGADITIDGSLNDTPLDVTVDDYYNNAILINVTMNQRYSVTDYDGANRKLTLTDIPVGWAAGNKCYLKNVNISLNGSSFRSTGDGLVETGTTTSTVTNELVDSGQNFSSTVVAGMRVKNVTDSTYSYVKSVDSNTELTLMDDIFTSGENYQIYGTRYGWNFDRVLTNQRSSQDILTQMCYESYSMLVKDYQDEYKIITLEGGATVGTLSWSIVEMGNAIARPRLTPLTNIYTDFTLNYAYDYAKKIYSEKHFVNKNSSSDSELDTYKTNCRNAQVDYKVNKKEWVYNADWIQDSTTAINFLSLMIQALTAQRLIVDWAGDIKNYFKYEIGDRVLIDFDYMIPTGVNNSEVFLVVGKSLNFKMKTVALTLLQVSSGSADVIPDIITLEDDLDFGLEDDLGRELEN